MPFSLAGQRPQTLVEFPLLVAELLRDPYPYLQIQVAFPLPAEAGKALVPEPQYRVRLNTGGQLDLGHLRGFLEPDHGLGVAAQVDPGGELEALGQGLDEAPVHV